MSIEYANSLFKNVGAAKRASISMFLQADSPEDAPDLDLEDAQVVNELAEEIHATGWEIPGEGRVTVDRARTLILDWAQGA